MTTLPPSAPDSDTSAELSAAVESCAQQISNIFSNITEAGKKISEACRQHPGFLRALKARLGSGVTMKYLRRLQALGDGIICEQVATGTVPHCDLLEKIPLEQQKAAISDGVRFPVGESDHRIIRLEAMSFDMARAAFGSGHVSGTQEIKERILAQETERNVRHSNWNREVDKRRDERREIAETAIKKYGGSIGYRKGVPVFTFPPGASIPALDMHLISEFASWYI
jgi:hypothetical protein